MHSLTEENYLKAIYRISQQPQIKITPTCIGEAVGVNAASVIDMIKKLTDKKLISYDKKKGAKLLDKGKKTAIDIVRKHRLWEVFLHEKLEYTWDVVHEIAEQLEHIKHQELANRLDKFLGHPTYDPHGDPIPNANGEIPETIHTPLSEIVEGKTCKVAAIKDTSTLFLQYLKKLQIGIGTKLKIVDKIPYDESVLIKIDNHTETTVSKKFVESILVTS